jgi:cytochrome c-type biogenesis protein CcmE
MQRRRIKHIVGLIIIIAAFFYLAWTSFSASFQFTLSPSEFLAAKQDYEGKVLKISGVVDNGSLSVTDQDYLFSISDENKATMKVHYKGMTPNTFREGADVVVTGKFNTGGGIFEAEEILAKCASKYEGSGTSNN